MLNAAGRLEVLHLNSDEAISDLPSWPSYDQDEIAAATDALRRGCVNYWTGEQGREFEREFSSYQCRTNHTLMTCYVDLSAPQLLQVAVRCFTHDG